MRQKVSWHCNVCERGREQLKCSMQQGNGQIHTQKLLLQSTYDTDVATMTPDASIQYLASDVYAKDIRVWQLRCQS